MQYFFISLIIGVCLTALLLILFFKAGKKNKKTKNADREMVLNCGDQSLISLYEQAISDNERDGIVEFVKERMAREEYGSTLNIIPAGELNKDTAPPEQPAPSRAREDVWPSEQAQEQTAEQAAEHLAEQAAEQAFEAVEMAVGPGFAQAQSLEDIDWQAVEESLQKRREEGERIMAQNLHIQEVLSKIKNIEETLMTEKQENKHG